MAENVTVNEVNDSASGAPKGLSRRQFLRNSAVVAGAGLLAVACEAPQTVTVEVPAEQMVLRMWTTRFFNPNINLHLNEEAQNAGPRHRFRRRRAGDPRRLPGVRRQAFGCG